MVERRDCPLEFCAEPSVFDLGGIQLSRQVLKGGGRSLRIVFRRGIVLRQVSESSLIGCVVESLYGARQADPVREVR